MFLKGASSLFFAIIYSMLKKSLLKISFVSGGNLFNTVLGFIFLTAVAKTLPIDEFGKYALLTTLLVGLSKIMDFGSNSYYVAQSIFGILQIEKTFISAKLILFMAAAFISLGVLTSLGLFAPYLLLIFILGLVAYGINYTFFAIFQKHQMFNFLVLINTIPAVIKVFFALLLFGQVITPSLSLTFSIFSLSIFGSGILYWFLPTKVLLAKPDLSKVANLIKIASPAGIGQLINEGFPAIANSIAKITQGFADTGIFSLGNKISQIFALFSLSIFTVLLPKNATRRKTHQGYNFGETLILGIGVLVMAASATLFAKKFILLTFGDKFAESANLLNILIFASAFTAIHMFMENYFFVEEQTKALFYISTSKLIIFLGLCTALIPRYNLWGLALAQLMSAIAAVTTTALAIVCKKKRY